MAIPNPNPNIADGMQCDNLTWSSNKIKSIIDTVSGALPTPKAGDAGKVLTVNAGATGYELDIPLTIDDTTSSETTTYSSDKIDELFTECNNKYELIYESTISESNIREIVIPTDKNYKSIIITISGYQFNSNTSFSNYIHVKTDKYDNYFLPSAFSNVSASANTEYSSILYADCTKNIIFGWGIITPNSSAFYQGYTYPTLLNNIVANEFTSIKFICTVDIPLNTKITVYAY